VNDRRRGLGRGLGALIPQGPTTEQRPAANRPVDVFFPERAASAAAAGAEPAGGTESTDGPAAQPVAEAPAAPAPQEAGAPEGPDQGLASVPGARFAELPIDAISPNPRQPRQVFDEEAMAELVHSIREVGLLQPVVVRAVGAPDGEGERYELIMGERRWRASREAGLERIPAIVRSTDDGDLLRDALLENLHRSQLNPLEEAAAYDQLLKDFGCTHEVLAQRIGRSRPQISNTLRLLKLSPAVQRRVAAGVISAGHARALLGLDEVEAQDRLAQRIVAEGLSVRAVEEMVALGDVPGAPAPRPRGRKPVAPALQDLAARLGDRFETRVKVDLGRNRGKITIEFASIPDLERIVGLLAPDDEGRAAS
jgi:ParB family chromosome partitioning protein